jgi:drug/metabolite transporter (DMT)-like permease
MNSPHRGLQPREAATLALLSAVWGGSFLFIKVAVDDIGPVLVAFGRLVLATATIGGWLLLRRGPAEVSRMLSGIPPGQAVAFAATGSALPFLLIAWAETDITSSLAGILNASTPLFTAVLVLCLRMPNQIRGWRSAGLLLGFAGVALVAGGDLSGSAPAIAAMLAAALLYATSAVLARRWFAGVEAQAIALLQVSVGTVLSLPALVFARPDGAPSIDSVAALVALGAGGTGVAYLLYYALMSTAGPQHAVAVTYLVPLVAVVYGRVLLGERVSLSALTGMAVIIAGQVITATPARRRPAKPAAIPDMAA